MLPVLLDLKFIKIYTFGVFLVLSLFWGAFLLWKNVRLTQYKEEEIFDSMIFSLIGGMFVGRLVYVLLNWSSFGFDILKFILINGYPGFSFYGCIAGGMLFLGTYFSFKKMGIFWQPILLIILLIYLFTRKMNAQYGDK